MNQRMWSTAAVFLSGILGYSSVLSSPLQFGQAEKMATVGEEPVLAQRNGFGERNAGHDFRPYDTHVGGGLGQEPERSPPEHIGLWEPLYPKSRVDDGSPESPSPQNRNGGRPKKEKKKPKKGKEDETISISSSSSE